MAENDPKRTFEIALLIAVVFSVFAYELKIGGSLSGNAAETLGTLICDC